MLSSDLRGKHKNHARVDENIKLGVRNHILSIPRIDSHYCRARTTRKFIEGGKTIADLHRDYQKLCAESNSPAANYMMYAKIFNEEFNLSFFIPKKDQCEFCTGYDNAQGAERVNLQENYERHRTEIDLSRKEKELDKKSDKIVSVYDLQAVLPCPSGDASSFYYVSKLNVLNLTICNIQTKHVESYVWHEGEAQRGVNEIGSCVLRYIDDLAQNSTADKPINLIFYSDNCAGQQKNRFIIAAYLYATLKYESIASITHTFLITGHTQNEGDSAHSLIERSVRRSRKSGPIYTPDQYITLIRSAKKSGEPFKVNEVCHEDIFDLKQLATDLGLNAILKNTRGEPVKIGDFRMIKIKKENTETLFYKTSFQQEEFDSVIIRKNPRKQKKQNKDLTTLKKNYHFKVGITEKKKNGLLALFKKKCIPRSYFDFYNNL